MEEVEQLCTRIAIIDKGRVIAQGTTDELKSMISQGEKVVVEVYYLEDEDLEKIRELPNVESAEFENNILTVRGKKEKTNLSDLLSFINYKKISYGKIYSELPTLNDVFLEITGKELRD